MKSCCGGRGVYGLKFALNGILQLDCSHLECGSLASGTVLEQREERDYQVPSPLDDCFRLNFRSGDRLSLRAFQCIALQCIDQLMSNHRLVLFSEKQIHFPRGRPTLTVTVDPRYEGYGLKNSVVEEIKAALDLDQRGLCSSEPPGCQSYVESVEVNDNNRWKRRHLPAISDENRALMSREVVRVRLAQKALLALVKKGLVTDDDDDDSPPPYPADEEQPPPYKPICSTIGAMTIRLESFYDFRLALLGNYYGQDETGNYQSQYWVGACRPRLVRDEKQVRIAPPSRKGHVCDDCKPRLITSFREAVTRDPSDGDPWLAEVQSSYLGVCRGSAELGISSGVRNAITRELPAWSIWRPWRSGWRRLFRRKWLTGTEVETKLNQRIAEGRLIKLRTLLENYQISCDDIDELARQAGIALKNAENTSNVHFEGLRHPVFEIGWLINSYDQVYVALDYNSSSAPDTTSAMSGDSSASNAASFKSKLRLALSTYCPVHRSRSQARSCTQTFFDGIRTDL